MLFNLSDTFVFFSLAAFSSVQSNTINMWIFEMYKQIFRCSAGLNEFVEKKDEYTDRKYIDAYVMCLPLACPGRWPVPCSCSIEEKNAISCKSVSNGHDEHPNRWECFSPHCFCFIFLLRISFSRMRAIMTNKTLRNTRLSLSLSNISTLGNISVCLSVSSAYLLSTAMIT